MTDSFGLDQLIGNYDDHVDGIALSGRHAIAVLALSESELRAKTPREVVALKQLETLLGKSIIELHDNISMLEAAQERLRAATFSEERESAGIVTF